MAGSVRSHVLVAPIRSTTRPAPEWRWFWRKPLVVVRAHPSGTNQLNHATGELGTQSGTVSMVTRPHGTALTTPDGGGNAIDFPNRGFALDADDFTVILVYRTGSSLSGWETPLATRGPSDEQFVQFTGADVQVRFHNSFFVAFTESTNTEYVLVVSHDNSTDETVSYMNGVEVDRRNVTASAASDDFRILNDGSGTNRNCLNHELYMIALLNEVVSAGSVRQLAADPFGMFRPWRPITVAGGGTTHQLAGTLATSLALSGDLYLARGLAGTLATSLALTGGLDLARGLAGTLPLTLQLSGTLAPSAQGFLSIGDAPLGALAAADAAAGGLAAGDAPFGTLASSDAPAGGVTLGDTTSGHLEVSDG